MRKGRLLAIGFLGMTSWLTMPGAQAAVTSLHADLTGADEGMNPDGTVKGDPDGKGTADITLDDASNQVCYELRYENIGQPTAAHIHTGAKGVAGPPAVDFKIKTNGNKGCVPADPTTLKAIRDNPGGHYVNIHTSEYGNGAIRGQLEKHGGH